MTTVVLVLSSNLRATKASGNVLGDIQSSLAERGLQLVPQFAGTTDPELSRYYTIQVPPDADPGQLAERLRTIDGVDAVYVQPEPSPAAP